MNDVKRQGKQVGVILDAELIKQYDFIIDILSTNNGVIE